MRAAGFDRYGSPQVVRVIELPDPVAGPGAVLVRVTAACVTSADVAARSGDPFAIRLIVGLTRPRRRVLGTEFAGVIESTGADVTRFAVGDRVVAASGATFGAHAELVTVAEDGAIAKIRDDIQLADALAVAEGALTALPFLRDHARLAAGQRILINGASGSVGSAAVQLAKLFGAHVTAVCSAANTDLVTALGADRVIDYGSEDFTAGGEYDVIFDAVGASTFGRSRKVLAPGGTYLTTVPDPRILLDGLRARRSGQTAKLALTGLRKNADKRADLEWLMPLVADGSLVPVIDSRYPLDRVADAHARVDTRRKRGAVLLEF
ncbi:NAD(P)-dependent alcohol dehydrogenase [Glaciihabitans arcticus]|uniref:NAD(P)-dependent alcohol dehydrogenase n=1 Tax=Glaciihabitans arcticus TaxID=2668039 RepID=A0A4V2JEN1_9MICO|nr:NAD(P)-dependent alcohol dehydrogenase [Glaciihabitans arcticus]TBN56229.1 NAD(P)-dependent alcohol dehydrogenase [Glaciihabitans arcticus]